MALGSLGVCEGCLSTTLNCKVLSPGQTDSQVDASWKLGSTCDSVWTGLACTCVDLRWLALKFARKSRQVFHRLATQPSQRKLSDVHWRIISQWNTGYVCFEMGFLRLACSCEETCQCVWPPNASLYASSTCAHLRPLAGPFDQGFNGGIYQAFQRKLSLGDHSEK